MVALDTYLKMVKLADFVLQGLITRQSQNQNTWPSKTCSSPPELSSPDEPHHLGSCLGPTLHASASKHRTLVSLGALEDPGLEKDLGTGQMTCFLERNDLCPLPAQGLTAFCGGWEPSPQGAGPSVGSYITCREICFHRPGGCQLSSGAAV